MKCLDLDSSHIPLCFFFTTPFSFLFPSQHIFSNGGWKCSSFSSKQNHFNHWSHRLSCQKYNLSLSECYVCTFLPYLWCLSFLHVSVFLEKILRVQPNVKKIYLLLRASDANSATYRLHNEVYHITITHLHKIILLVTSYIIISKSHFLMQKWIL